METSAAYAALLRDTHRHPWDSVDSVLARVTPAAWSWACEAYADVEREPGWPPPGTVAWQANHLFACKAGYLETVRTWDRMADVDHVVIDDPVVLRRRFHELSDRFIDTVAAIPSARFAEPLGDDGMTMAGYLHMTVRHEIWHAGQIAMLLRLHAHARPAAPCT
jgi:uncharacterized damage-inducible protein DinB